MIPVSPDFRNKLDAQASTPALSFIFKNYPIYTAENLPEASAPKWGVSGPASVAGGKLTLLDNYSMGIPNPANNGAETILEVKAQVTAGGILTIHLGDDTYSQDIQIYGTYPGGSPGAIVNPVTSQVYAIDPSSAVHTYKIVMQGNSGEIYFDGSPVMTPTAPGNPGASISIGFSSSGTDTADIYPVFVTADLSSIVKSYGQIQKRGDQVTSGDITIGVDNTDGRWKDVIFNPGRYFTQDIELRLSFIDPAFPPPVEFLALSKNKLLTTRFNSNAVDIGLKDKFYYLATKVIGAEGSPVDFTNINPADLLWDILTTYGGLDSTTSTANKDIDYTAWLAWKAYCTGISMALSAEFTGQDIVTILQSYIKTTNSAVYCESDGKIRVTWWGNTGIVPVYSLVGANKKDIAILDIDSTDLFNRQQVYYGYDTSTSSWAGSETADDSGSQAIYGVVTNIVQDTTIWHYTSASALNLAQRLLVDTVYPAQRIQVTTFLSGFTFQVYDGITLTDTLLGLIGQAVRIEQVNLDLDKLEATITGKIIAAGFTNYLELDDSTLGQLEKNLLL